MYQYCALMFIVYSFFTFVLYAPNTPRRIPCNKSHSDFILKNTGQEILCYSWLLRNASSFCCLHLPNPTKDCQTQEAAYTRLIISL